MSDQEKEARQGEPPDTNSALPCDDALAIGARAISQRCFGGALDERQIYRLAETDPEPWGIFKVLGKLAARPSRVREEIHRREQAKARQLEPAE